MRNPIAGLLAVLLVGPGASDAQAATLFVDMVPGGIVDGSRTLAPGDNFSVNILIDEVLDLAGFQFEVEFDETVLSASSIVSGGIFGADTFLADSTINVASIRFSELTLAVVGVGVPAPTVLASLQFSVLGEGTSALDLRNSILSDSFAGPIGVESEIDGQLIAQRSAQPVPEPASLLLVSAGLCGLAVRRFR
jgi:hypothetical protein